MPPRACPFTQDVCSLAPVGASHQPGLNIRRGRRQVFGCIGTVLYNIVALGGCLLNAGVDALPLVTASHHPNNPATHHQKLPRDARSSGTWKARLGTPRTTVRDDVCTGVSTDGEVEVGEDRQGPGVLWGKNLAQVLGNKNLGGTVTGGVEIYSQVPMFHTSRPLTCSFPLLSAAFAAAAETSEGL